MMVGEALLWDPRLFSRPACPLLSGRMWDLRPPAHLAALDVGLEYLDICGRYPTPHHIMKRHMQWLLHHTCVAWPRLTDMLHFEGYLSQKEYFPHLRGALEGQRREWTDPPTPEEGAGRGQGGPGGLQDGEGGGTDGGGDAGHNRRIVEELLGCPADQRPVYSHGERTVHDQHRPNEYKQELRAERRLAADTEENEAFDLFGED